MASSDTEKQIASHGEVEGYPSKADESINGGILTEFSLAEQKRITRQLDRRLVVMVGLLYCVSLMDRTNLGAANIAGMSKDLVLGIDSRYSIVTLLFFITYIMFQSPSTILVRKIGPRIHLACITVLWGSVMVGMGFVKSWKVLAGLRVVLGVCESGLFPICAYLLSTWYTRYELGKRNAFFYLIGIIASAFSGILAAGLMQMDGLGNLAGWRWIFIMEGILSCLLGFLSYLLLIDFPDSTRKPWRFLSDRERDWVIAKVNADRGDARTLPFHLGQYLRYAADWKIWTYAFFLFASSAISYALSYFLPVILVDNMGFTVFQAQCLAAPPYAVAGIVMITCGYMGDKYKLRAPFIAGLNVISIIGLALVGFHPNSRVRYFGVFLVTTGSNASIPVIMSYQANNVRGQWKRAFSSASMVGCAAVGGIYGSLVFRAQDAPNYRPGLYACIAVCLVSLLLLVALSISFTLLNAKADRGEKELEASDEDFQPGFRYTY